MIGKFLALPFRLANAPIRAGEKLLAKMCGSNDIAPGDRIASLPLESVAHALEEIDDHDR
jgi:hypothetical protein